METGFGVHRDNKLYLPRWDIFSEVEGFVKSSLAFDFRNLTL